MFFVAVGRLLLLLSLLLWLFSCCCGCGQFLDVVIAAAFTYRMVLLWATLPNNADRYRACLRRVPRAC